MGRARLSADAENSMHVQMRIVFLLTLAFLSSTNTLYVLMLSGISRVFITDIDSNLIGFNRTRTCLI